MKFRMFFLTPFFLVVLLLSSCAEKWEKPGMTDSDFQRIQAVCDDKALTHFPPIIRQIQVEGARMNPIVTSCTGAGAAMRCGTSGGQYEPPKFAPVDDNQAARAQDVRNCLFDNGWRLIQ